MFTSVLTRLLGFCAEMVDTIGTQVLESPAWESDDDDVRDIRDCIATRLIPTDINMLGTGYTVSITLARICRKYLNCKRTATTRFLKLFWVFTTKVVLEVNPDLWAKIWTNSMPPKSPNYQSATVFLVSTNRHALRSLAGKYASYVSRYFLHFLARYALMGF